MNFVWVLGIETIDDIEDSTNNIIKNNKVTSNKAGVWLRSSFNNHIYNNYFDNMYNAGDDGDNIWNITKIAGTNIIDGPHLGGNYWSDYPGEDTNEDGLGDTLLPYNSSGNITNGGDWLPLIQGGIVAPTIMSYDPLSPVNDIEGAERTFSITAVSYTHLTLPTKA